MGRRVKKDVDGSVKYYIYDQEDIRFETDDAGTIIAEYIHGSGIDEPLAMRRNGQNYYYHVNGLGTVTALTDSNKAVVQEYVYDSFGQIISQTGTIENPYTYTAREYDEETGLYYYRARYYEAKIGRFISEDPIGIRGGINLFAYVGNNPVNYTDPLGLFPNDPIIKPPPDDKWPPSPTDCPMCYVKLFIDYYYCNIQWSNCYLCGTDPEECRIANTECKKMAYERYKSCCKKDKRIFR